jgi:hypothetical protein
MNGKILDRARSAFFAAAAVTAMLASTVQAPATPRNT